MGHLVGGISSAGRAMPQLDGEPFLVERSRGPYIWDRRGRHYVDTALGFGGSILGHAPAVVMQAVVKALENGPLPAFAHELEEEAAAALAATTGQLSRVVFVNTGSEAVHLACRIARAATGRGRIAKFAAGYDGWYDDMALGHAGSAEAEMTANARPSNPQTVLLRFNDPDDVERLFAEHDDIAAVVIEPMLANAGCLLPAPGYLQHLQAVARRNGALLVLDEVLMGYRLHAGLTGLKLGLDPDLATVGKAIGSGIAVAAVVGRPDLMSLMEEGRVFRAGTYAGNPVACAAVAATMKELAGLDYAPFLRRGDLLRREIEGAFARAGIAFSSVGYGSVFGLWFAPAPPATYHDAVAMARPDLSLQLHLELRRRGVLIMASPYGRLYLSFAHDEPALQALEEGFTGTAEAWRSGR
jgi:glutamate-1-semialdehyde 2,1-aminomutase